jgi:hypothetical protein
LSVTYAYDSISDILAGIDEFNALVEKDPTLIPADFGGAAAKSTKARPCSSFADDDNGELIDAPSLPAFDEVTMITVNLFDNGISKKNKRWGINLQFFTETKPFTPHKRLAVWDGCCGVMRDPAIYDRWLQAYIQDHLPGTLSCEETERVTDAIMRAGKIRCQPPLPVVGTPMKAIGGKTRYWDCFVTLYQTLDEELKVEIAMPGGLVVIELDAVFKKKATEPGYRGAYDPNNLWVSKMARRAKGGQ